MSKKLLLAGLFLFLTSCNYFPFLEESERNTPLEDPFREGLRQGYIALADFEYAQGDRDDAGHYRYKARTVIRGNTLDPEIISTRDIPTDNLNEIAEARNFLMMSFAKDAKNIAPELSANAQVNFDCWVEEQEENFQPEDIKKCRQAFRVAEDGITAALKAYEEANKPKPVQMPASFYVFFDFDKFEVTPSGDEVLKKIADEVPNFNPSKIFIGGHADRSGSRKYNQRLSEKRAEAVMTVLMKHGVFGAMLESEAYGEDAPRVETKDGVKEPENRFVEIKFLK